MNTTILSGDAAGHLLELVVCPAPINQVVVKDETGKELGNIPIDAQVQLIQALFDANPAIFRRFTGRVPDLINEIQRHNEGLDSIYAYVSSKSFIGNELDLLALIQSKKTAPDSPLLKP